MLYDMKFIFNKPEQFAYTLKIHMIQSLLDRICEREKEFPWEIGGTCWSFNNLWSGTGREQVK